MKAIVYNQYGNPDVLNIQEIERPVPAADELLVKVYATTATAAEGMMRRGDTLMSRIVLGLFKPRKKYRVLGIELAGIVEQTGDEVVRLSVGDKVYGFAGFSPGAYAEYICLPNKASLVKMPENLNFQESASVVDGASTSYFFLKEKANIQKGQKVLIVGASGSIGVYAIQLAKQFGANVTGVCSAKNRELVKQLGAQSVIDYNESDFTEGNTKYDIVFDTVGKSSFSKCKKVLTDRGVYLATNGNIVVNLLLNFSTSLGKGKRFMFGMSVHKTTALNFIKALVEENTMKPVIDKVYPFEKISEAHRYVELGHKVGNVVIDVSNLKQP